MSKSKFNYIHILQMDLLVFILLFFDLVRFVQGELNNLELINVKSFKTYENLSANFAAQVQELTPKSSNGSFWSLKKLLLGKKIIENDPQEDLNELAQYYAALNSADVSVIYYLKQHCKKDGLFDPASDPILCQKYIETMKGQVKIRLDTITTRILAGREILHSPPRWLSHSITVSELLIDPETEAAKYFKIRQAISRIISPIESDEFDRTPNILNSNNEIEPSVNENQYIMENQGITKNQVIKEDRGMMQDQSITEDRGTIKNKVIQYQNEDITSQINTIQSNLMLMNDEQNKAASNQNTSNLLNS